MNPVGRKKKGLSTTPEVQVNYVKIVIGRKKMQQARGGSTPNRAPEEGRSGASPHQSIADSQSKKRTNLIGTGKRDKGRKKDMKLRQRGRLPSTGTTQKTTIPEYD